MDRLFQDWVRFNCEKVKIGAKDNIRRRKSKESYIKVRKEKWSFAA